VVPGAAIGVAFGEIDETAAFGITNVDDPQEVTTSTIFQIGSISKTITSTALMQMVEQGTLSLEDTVRTHVPEFAVADPDVSNEVEIRHLVTHTTGWEVDPPIQGTSGDDALELLMADTVSLPQIAPLGGPFSYNNLNAAVIGRILEVVAGDTFESVIQANVLDPLGLTNSWYDPEKAQSLPHAVGHATGEDGTAAVQEPYALPRIANPAGGLIASIEDLLRYGMFQAGIGPDRTDVLSGDALTTMQTGIVPGGSLGQVRVEGVGVSWFTIEREGVKLVSHGGGTNGQQSLLVIAPEREFVFAMLTNSESGGDLALLAARWLVKALLGSTALEDKPGVPLDAENVTDAFGTYTAPDGTSLTIETGFVAQGPPRIVVIDESGEPVFLDSLEKDVWFAQDTYTRKYVDFVRNDQGEVGWIRMGGRLTPKVG
jgi:CubicO group peptidase (beta-lactamase class C family)